MKQQKPLTNFFSVLLCLTLLYVTLKHPTRVIDMVSFEISDFLFSSNSNTLNVAVIECPGGTDKGPDGHRKDSQYLIDGINNNGANAMLFQYTDATSEKVLRKIIKSHRAHAYVSRVDPGEYEACTEEKYHEFLDKLIANGVLAYNSPKDMTNLGSKRSLLNLAGMYYFPNSTYVYATLDQFDAFFPQTLKLHGSRVIKQNRGSKGEGVWWVQLIDENSESFFDLNPFNKNSIVSRILEMFKFSNDEPNSKVKSPVPQFYSPILPEFTLFDDFENENDIEEDEKDAKVSERMKNIQVKIIEARDNHEEDMTLSEFRNNIVKSYLNTSADFVVDMEYLPRISEGEVRLILSGREVLYIVNKQPQTANTTNVFSANLGAGAEHIWESPDEWSHVVDPFKYNIDTMLERMNVDRAPVLWTVDFIRYGKAHEDTQKFVISEINASCVGFSANPEMGDVIGKILVENLKNELGI